MMQYGNDKMNGVAAEVKADTEMESDFIESGEFFGSSEPAAEIRLRPGRTKRT